MAFCPACGNPVAVAADTRFCARCGRDLTVPAVPDRAPAPGSGTPRPPVPFGPPLTIPPPAAPAAPPPPTVHDLGVVQPDRLNKPPSGG